MLNLPSGLRELCGRGEEGIKEPEDGEEPCEILPVNEIIAGDLQLGVPFQASVPLLSFQTPSEKAHPKSGPPWSCSRPRLQGI